MAERTREADKDCVVMAFSEHGNAFDCFPYTPEALVEKAAALRVAYGEESYVTMEPSAFARLV